MLTHAFALLEMTVARNWNLLIFQLPILIRKRRLNRFFLVRIAIVVIEIENVVLAFVLGAFSTEFGLYEMCF